MLHPGPGAHFPAKGIWVPNVPSKLAFYVWEAAWGKVLTLDKLQRRGWQFPNRLHLCGQAEETVNHLLLHCSVISSLWEIIFSLMGASWVFLRPSRRLFTARRDLLWAKRGKSCGILFLCVFFG